MGLITRQIGPNAKGSKLTFVEMDNNLYYLQSVGVSGVTYSENTLTLIDPTGGTKSVIIESDTNFTGGTITGSTNFTNGITSNIISATTYQNLPIDIRVTGGTYENGIITFTDNTGGTFNVIGLFTGSTDVFITAATYNGLTNTITLTDNTNTSFNTYINAFSGLTVNGELSATTISGGTLYGDGSNLTGISTQDTFVTGGTYSNGDAIFRNNTGGTFNVTGFYTGDTTTITGVTNIGSGITIFDSVLDRNIKINSITGDSLQKITTSLSSNTINLGINEQNLTLWDLVVQGNRLLSGNVSYISGLTFSVSPLEYLINGTIYEITSSTTVTLNSGDSTYDRIDVIFADISGNTGVLEGTPSENPEKPIVDGDTQVEVTFVLIPANSTTANINEFIIYNENSGPPTEWTFGAVGLQPTRISGSSTGQVYSGNTSIRVSGVTGSFTTSFRLTGSTILNTNQYATLQFAIRNLSANTTTSQIRLRFLNTGGTQNGNAVFMNAAGSSGFVQYSSTNTSSWQLISIPLWRFYLTNTNVQVVEFSFNSPNARYYFDLIEFVEGTASSPPSNSWTTIKGDGATTITAPNPNATLTISGGTNIGSFISGTSTVVLNLDNNINLNGVSANTISATTYQNLPTDVRVTGGTYSAGTIIFTNNTGGTFNVTGLTTGSTSTISGDYLPLSGGTVTGSTQFTNGLTSNTISATTYQNLPTDVRVTGGTYASGTITFTNNTGGTFNVTGLTTGSTSIISGEYLPLSGGTVTGSTQFTAGLTANTISATTYLNLPITTDVFVTGGTYSAGTSTFTNNTGGTFNVSGFVTGDTYVTGLTFNTSNYNLTIGRNDGVSFTDSLGALAGDLTVTGGTYDIFTGNATFTNNTGGTFVVSGFLVGYTDLLVTGATYNNNTFTFKNSSGGTFDVSFNTVTGLTSTGTIQSSILSATTYQNLPDNVTGNYLPLSGGTVIGSTNFTNGLTANTISATTYQNLPISGLTEGNNINISGSNGNFTISVTGLTQGLSGEYLPLSGGTVSGGTQFTNGLTANTISATTYQNLPVTADTFTTGFTYSNNTFTIGRNQGLSSLTTTINTVTGLTSTGTISSSSLSATTLTINGISITGDTFVTGGTYSAGTITFRNNQNTTFPVTGLTQPFTGGTVSGATNFTNGLTVNTISATTYQNLPVSADTFTTGFSYSNNVFTINRNQGLGSLSAFINTMTGLTINGQLTVTGNTNVSGDVRSFSFLSTQSVGDEGGEIRLSTAQTNNTLSGDTVTIDIYQNKLRFFEAGGTNRGAFIDISSTSAGVGTDLLQDTYVTAFTYSNNTFTINRNQGLSPLTTTINTVTGLTSTGTISSSNLSATTLTVNGVQITGDTFVTGGTYSAGTITFRNNRNSTFPVTGLTTGVTITNNVNNYLLTATGTDNTVNAESGATFDGTTLTLTKNSSNPNITITDTGSTTNDTFIRFANASSASLTYAMGIDKSDSNKFKISLFGGSTASPSNTSLIQMTSGGSVNVGITLPSVPALTVGSDSQVDVFATSTTTQLGLYNGATKTLRSAISQFSNFAALESNVGSTVANEPFYIVNDSVSGQTLFRNNSVDMLSINPTGTTTVNGGAGVNIAHNLSVAGSVSIGQSSPQYTLDVSSGVESIDEIAFRVANDGNKGVYFAPTANSSSFNQNTISGDTVIVGTPGESLVIGSNTGYAGLRFSGGSGALAMTSSGWLGLGPQYLVNPTQQPTQQLDVAGNARFRSVGATAFFANLNITSNGTLTTATSDIRLKENIEPLTNSLEKLLQLTGVTYSWIGQEGKRIGFIAQDVEKVIPELVFTNINTEDKIKGIHMDNITAVLVESIKEQQQQIDSLKSEIQYLKNIISNIGG